MAASFPASRPLVRFADDSLATAESNHDVPDSETKSIGSLNAGRSNGNQTSTVDRLEELELCRAWRDHQDLAARNRLVESHLDAVRALAHKYASGRAPLDDLVAVGRIGLLRACETFDPDRGLRFMTYASFWVRAEMLSFVWHNRSLVPAGRSKLQRRLHPLRHERERMIQETGDRDIVDEALADRAGVSIEQFRRGMSEWNRRDVALDEPIAAGSQTTRLEELSDDAPDSEVLLLSREVCDVRRDVVAAALESLDERERFIVESHLMAGPEEELSLSQLGQALGVSRERVRQLELRAKRKIKSQLKRTPYEVELLLVS